MTTTHCDTCGGEIRLGDYPFCKGNPDNHAPSNMCVVGDDIPGGALIEHGICNDDGSPRRYYTKSEMARVAKEKGLTPFVRHRPDNKDSDKSANTQRFV
jgi:hypothetical protein